MNEQQLAAVKRALKALRSCTHKHAGTRFQEWYFDEDGVKKSITALQSIISQDALHKMAEESRTSGLRLDDWDKIGCVNHDCDQCKAVQEPVGEMRFSAIIEGMIVPVVEQELPVGTKLYTTPPAPQPVPVKTYHDGKPWPVAPKPWVGLTDEENLDLISDAKGMGGRIRADGQLLELLKMHQAKLKEKNHDH